MSNISRGTIPITDFENEYNKHFNEVKLSRSDNDINSTELNERDQQFPRHIVHPTTGEKLDLTKGYATNQGKFYYLEFENSKGQSFNYSIHSEQESIGGVIHDDMKKTQSNSAAMTQSSNTTANSDTLLTKREQQRKDFDDFMDDDFHSEERGYRQQNQNTYSANREEGITH